MRLLLAVTALLLVLSPAAAQAQAPRGGGTYLIENFRFGTGETLAQMKVHYTTLGSPSNPAVLVLHGTGGTGAGMAAGGFSVLFGPGQPLDAARHFIVLPDAIGHGGSSKPSDGLRMAFPHYDYADMVEAQRRLLVDHLGVTHLKLVIGNSMGGMEAWTWAEAYPDFMDAVVPLAASPTQVAARNWISRRLVIDLIKADPEWRGGDYVVQPKALSLASTYYGLLTAGGTRAQYAALGSWKAADDAVAGLLARPSAGDANDLIYQLLAARTYDPEPRLGLIKARVLAINSEDDERNPVELGVLPRLLPKVKGARFFIIPAGPETRGHGTTGNAALWSGELRAFLAEKP
jgi:homoserine O-acetyltransferase